MHANEHESYPRVSGDAGRLFVAISVHSWLIPSNLPETGSERSISSRIQSTKGQ